MPPERPRNDPRQYDDLAGEWGKAGGAFAALNWLAASRAELIPPAPRPGAVLLDLGCGGGLLAPWVEGYVHVGLDLSEPSLQRAVQSGIRGVRGDIAALPFPDALAEVVVAGEILEHVPDLDRVVAEIARVLRPGGVLVADTINDTRWARFSMVTVGERVPGGPPPRIHDPSLFVRPERLVEECRRHGVTLSVRGLRPSFVDYARFLLDRRREVRMLPTRSLAGVYQAVGRKADL